MVYVGIGLNHALTLPPPDPKRYRYLKFATSNQYDTHLVVGKLLQGSLPLLTPHPLKGGLDLISSRYLKFSTSNLYDHHLVTGESS